MLKTGQTNSGSFKPKYAPIEIREQFGLWTVLAKGSFKHNQQRWIVRCKCGSEREVAQQHLRGGKSTKCLQCNGKHKTRKMLESGKYGKSRRMLYVKAATDKMYESQSGACPLCSVPFESLDEAVWDHDHSTGLGRSLLHRGCNVFLGFIERDPEILVRTKLYCEKYGIL